MAMLGARVTLSTMGHFDSIDFFMPYGLSLFSVTLLANPEKSVLKNLPKSVSLLVLTEKKNRVVTGEDTDSGN